MCPAIRKETKLEKSKNLFHVTHSYKCFTDHFETKIRSLDLTELLDIQLLGTCNMI